MSDIYLSGSVVDFPKPRRGAVPSSSADGHMPSRGRVVTQGLCEGTLLCVVCCALVEVEIKTARELALEINCACELLVRLERFAADGMCS
jgi:hypothetical protein